VLCWSGRTHNTLTGAGGSGKIRLALQVAGELLNDYPDGVWVLELAVLAQPDLIAPAALGALGLAEGLLQACPHIRLLATSREALHAEGEVVWRVSTLALPERQATEWPPLERLTQCEAVGPFIQRAQAAEPSFRVTNENAPAVAEVCHRLDGIPLAIELAAARIGVLSAAQIEARLGDCFQLLTGGRRTALRTARPPRVSGRQVPRRAGGRRPYPTRPLARDRAGLCS
jgi:predicted ATPase